MVIPAFSHHSFDKFIVYILLEIGLVRRFEPFINFRPFRRFLNGCQLTHLFYDLQSYIKITLDRQQGINIRLSKKPNPTFS
jgi:hypothetical protein